MAELLIHLTQMSSSLLVPDATPDLSPWLADATTQALLDPNSIDVSFQFPGVHPACRGHCVLMQIRYAQQPYLSGAGVIGVEAMGYCYDTQQWCFSTIGDWRFEGPTPPTLEAQRQLKRFLHGVFQLLQQHTCSNPIS